jgi:hypothetical protein
LAAGLNPARITGSGSLTAASSLHGQRAMLSSMRATVEKLPASGGNLTIRPLQFGAVTGNRSLDEFGADEDNSAEPETTGKPTQSSAAPAAAESQSETQQAPVEPLAETFAWSAAGGDCAACGETVANRWRDGSALLCEDCKAW